MIYFILICLFGNALADVLVNTSSGPVVGVSSNAEDVEAFLGIPYAEPPIEELRFAKPVPKKPWTQAYSASSLPPPCPQISWGPYYFMPDITNMSEDCLYLNIWAPKLESPHDLRPVIIYIHPGGYMTGSSNLKAHDGSHLASRGDVVVVTINYRLGALGFYLAFSEEAEGNMALHDQIVAIKWVKENAKQFNGDPDKIVLMGVSAGGYSISAHMVSPLSKNLFNKAIIQSGTLVNPMMQDDNAMLYENSQTVAQLVGCTNDTTSLKSDPRSVMKCLKNASVEDIISAEKKMYETNPVVFFPRVNDELLPKSIVDLLREGKFRKDVDVMTGVVKDEGELFMLMLLQENFGRYGKKNEIHMSKSRAFALSNALLFYTKQPNTTNVVKYYMKQVTNRTAIGYSKMIANLFGDYIISCSTVFFADFLSLKGNPVYFYKFEYQAASTAMADWVGTAHLDEVQYVFGSPYHENFTREEKELSHRLMDRWSAFAKSGNPNLPNHMPWPRYSYHNPLYLNFGQEEESIRWKPSNRCNEVWRKRYNADIDTELIRYLEDSASNATQSNLSQIYEHVIQSNPAITKPANNEPRT